MATYTPIQSIVLTSTSGSVTFSNIPQSYTDLILVATTPTTGSGADYYLRFNSDSGSNYSDTRIIGNGSSAASYRSTSQTQAVVGTIYPQQGNIINHIMNYSNTTTYKTVISRGGYAGYLSQANASLWRSTAAITSVYVFAQSDNFAVGSTFDLYGIGVAAMTNPFAAGGTSISYDSSYVYHTFTASGKFTPLKNMTADILVVGGGGSGGTNQGGSGTGGGGGGYVTYSTSQSLTAGTTYTCTVGAGGSYTDSNTVATNGSTSSLIGTGLSLSANPGTAITNVAGAYGTAGGNSGNTINGTSTNYTGGSAGSGTSGGTGTDGRMGGGGAGATANGTSATGTVGGTAGNGGNGYSAFGSYYGGGGGGGAAQTGTPGTAGLGGGGVGGYGSTYASALGANGLTNTGGGGGGCGGATNVIGGTSGQGGSGIVIVRYPR